MQNKTKKILIISESFLQGGLERHIITQFSEKNMKYVPVFAFHNYKKNEELNGFKIYEISLGYTIKDVLSTINELVDIIKKEKIDVIHVHPFYTLFPAIFASQITGVAIVYTIHGFSSINFAKDINSNILYRVFLNYCKPLVISVDKSYLNVLKYRYLAENVTYIPNSIDTSKYYETEVIKNNKWLLIVRLDKDKKKEIVCVLENLKDMNIHLDIIGDGSEKEALCNLVKKLNLEKKVNFLGFKENVSEYIKNYNGVMGLGQVVLEGLCSNRPVLLIGYGKISGMIDKKLFNEIKNNNFVNRNTNNIFSLEEFKNVNDNLDKYLLAKEVKREFCSKVVNKKYFEAIDNAVINKFDNILDIYNDLINLNQEVLEKSFYNSIEVCQILENNLINRVTDDEIIKSIILFKQQEKINLLENMVSSIGLRTVTKRTIKNIFEKCKLNK